MARFLGKCYSIQNIHIVHKPTNALFKNFVFLLFRFWHSSPHWAMASSFTRFLDYTRRRTTVGRTPLDELSARRRDLYLTTHKTNNRQIFMPPVGFEPTISAGERPQTYALDGVATGTGFINLVKSFKFTLKYTTISLLHVSVFNGHHVSAEHIIYIYIYI